VPAAASTQTYAVSGCVGITSYQWRLDGNLIAACTTASCNVSFAANTLPVTAPHTVTLSVNGASTALETYAVTQSAAAVPPVCGAAMSGPTALPATGGTFTYGVDCVGATDYYWALDNVGNACTTSSCAISIAGNSSSLPVTHTVTALVAGTYGVRTVGPITVTVAAAPAACTLDFDGNSTVNTTDALLFNRWLLGFRGIALVNGIAPFPAGTTTTAFASAVTGRMTLGLVHDFDGDLRVLPETDGLLFMRLTQGLTGAAVTNRATGAGALRATHEVIRTHINSSCGTNFAAQPSTVALFDTFDGASLDPVKWTEVRGGIGVATVSGSTVTFGANASANTQGKVAISGSRIVVEGRFTGLGTARDTTISLVDATTGDTITFGDTSYQFFGLYSYGTGQYLFTQQNQGGTTAAFKEYRLTIDGTSLTLQRGDVLDAFTESRSVTLPTSVVGKTFYLRIATAGVSYSPGTFDWVRVTVQ